MILGLSTITRRETPLQRRAYSALSAVLVGLVMVILVSAYQRLTLNELAHGFFRLRTYSHVFYVWLAALLVAVVVLEALHHERLFALAALIAALGFAASLSALNVDAFTARQSVLRAEQGRYLNVADLASLSSDAVPPLVEAFQSPRPTPPLHQAIGAILVCHNAREDTSSQGAGDWRSFSLSRAVAQAAVQKVATELKAYVVLPGRESDLRVRTPSNVVYDCY
jgi:hypothetical protein